MPRKKVHNFFAFISDIHANIDALEAVLADIEQWPVHGILCLGDIVGYGPEPAACVQRVKDVCALAVIGNHEALLFLKKKIAFDQLPAKLGQPLILADEQLSPEQMQWLRSLTRAAVLDPITISHAGLQTPEKFIYIQTSPEAKAHFALQETFISFQGHTHVPLIWEEYDDEVLCYDPAEVPLLLDETKRYAVNVGSVGQPRDEDPRACYVLYDYHNRVLIHRRVKYDLNQAQKRFKAASLHPENARRLRRGE